VRFFKNWLHYWMQYLLTSIIAMVMHECVLYVPAQPTGPCWFCLGSPEVEKHLVVSVGDEVCSRQTSSRWRTIVATVCLYLWKLLKTVFSENTRIVIKYKVNYLVRTLLEKIRHLPNIVKENVIFLTFAPYDDFYFSTWQRIQWEAQNIIFQ